MPYQYKREPLSETETTAYKTLKQVQGDKSGLFARASYLENLYQCGCLKQLLKIPPPSLCQREEMIVSLFEKGGSRGILW